MTCSIRPYQIAPTIDDEPWAALVDGDVEGRWQGRGASPAEAVLDCAARILRAVAPRAPVSGWGHEDAAWQRPMVAPSHAQIDAARAIVAEEILDTSGSIESRHGDWPLTQTIASSLGYDLSGERWEEDEEDESEEGGDA